MAWPQVSSLFGDKRIYKPGEVLRFAGFELTLKVNKRARRISLRIDNRSGQAIVSAPRLKDLPQAVDFALSRSDWLCERTQLRPAHKPFSAGQVIDCGGKRLLLRATGNLAAARLQTQGADLILTAGAEGAAFHRRVETYLRRQALGFANDRTLAYTKLMNYQEVKVSLSDTKARWGSCTPSRKTIRVSWRLIMAPPFVFDYVCAHEAAHLKHPNHSPQFWAEVEALYGDTLEARRWLKDQGMALLSYRL
jgi:predicted metal-dependent hydrolase